jgi:hypothetical protein
LELLSGEFLESPDFSLLGNVWTIRLYPRGYTLVGHVAAPDMADYVGVLLHTKAYDRTGVVEWSVLVPSRRVEIKGRQGASIMKVGAGHGLNRICQRSEIRSKDDTIKIRLRLERPVATVSRLAIVDGPSEQAKAIGEAYATGDHRFELSALISVPQKVFAVAATSHWTSVTARSKCTKSCLRLARLSSR